MLPEPLAAVRSSTRVLRFQYCGKELGTPAAALMSSSCTGAAAGAAR
jgi:hypothetical protein